MKVTGIKTLHCHAGWRNYSFVKLTTDEGIVGWSEYDEGFGSPGVTAAIAQLAKRVVDLYQSGWLMRHVAQCDQ